MSTYKENIRVADAQEYMERCLDELDTALAKVQDAWFVVGEATGDDNVYDEAYPFGEDDLNEVMLKVWEWTKVCKRSNAARFVEMFYKESAGE